MTFLPIVERELRVASRNSRMYWQRVPYVIVAAFVCGSAILTANQFGTSRQATTTFFMLTQTLMYAAVFMGVNETADCISRETRQGTLGLLFLTDLKGYDIVLGKLSANVLKSLYAFLAMLPVVSIVMLLGGITAGDVFCTVLALFNGIFFAHSLALLVSSLSRETQKAYSATTALLVFFIWPLVGLSHLPHAYGGDVFKFLAMFSPYYTLNHASSFSFGPPPRTATALNPFWTSLILSQAFSWGCLMVASSIVRNCWRTKAEGAWKDRVRAYCQTFLHGNAAFRLRRRLELLEVNPFLWVISRERFKKVAIWSTMLFVLVCFGIVFVVIRRPGIALASQEKLFLGAGAILALGAVLKVYVGMDAARYFDRMKRSGELELLLSSTPISVDRIVEGQWLFLRRLFLGPLLLVLTCNILLALAANFAAINNLFGLQDVPARVAFICWMVILSAFVVLDAWAIGWFGMWMGISSRYATQSTNSAVIPILVLPWLVFGFISALIAFAGDYFRIGYPNFFFFLALWTIICVLNNVYCVRYAKRHLFAEFRTLALTYADERLTWLGRIGRTLGRMWRGLH